MSMKLNPNQQSDLGKLHFYIKTYGCQTNVHDSEKMALLLMERGWIECEGSDHADIVILNTCHIREKAKHKVLTELGVLKQLKEKRAREGRVLLLGVSGCVAQAEGAELFEEAPYIDVVMGTKAFPDVVRLVEVAWQKASEQKEKLQQHLTKYGTVPVLKGAQVLDIDFPQGNKFASLPLIAKSEGAAFVAIQEGCDKFCTYCVVPYTRGAEVSRSASSILEEVRNNAAKGIREITLLGQNVNAYSGVGPDGTRWSFADLLKAVSRIQGIERIFYTSSHPLDVTMDVIEAHAQLSNLMPFWHLPVQSGSDKILKVMNRRHTSEEYLRLVEAIRRLNPQIALSSDFIVGFPGETDKDFEATLNLVQTVKFAQSFSFKYSPRPGTPAADWSDQIDEEVKSQRLTKLQEVLREQQRAFNEACIGRDLSVMFRRYGKKEHQILGKSPYMQSVVVDVENPEMYENQIWKVSVKEATATCLTGELVEEVQPIGNGLS